MKTAIFQRRYSFYPWRMALSGGLVYGLTVLGLLMVTTGQARYKDNPRATLSLLSGQAHLVSGGNALVQIEVMPGTRLNRVRVTLNEEDITALFRRVSDSIADTHHRLRGLVSGLELGETILAVAVLDASGAPIENAGDTLILTNWPLRGPLISGPHETPFYC